MYYSKLFGKTKLEVPADADSVNARYLTQGGFIDKLVAGVYTFLPLGLRVLKKINQIIREEMNAIGGQEILMPSLHPRESWRTTGRDTTMDEILFRTKGAGDHDFIFGPSHEEIVTPLVGRFVQSYKDLPIALYQIQTKFRNEPRAKSGILRGREFGMKDFYSFHADEEDLENYYQKAVQAYFNVFKRCGLDAYIVEASGGAFTDKYSHEFAVITPAGEDTIVLCTKCRHAQNKEIAKAAVCEKCKIPLVEKRAIEAGNIFKLGTKFSTDFGLGYTDKEGKKRQITMGCYGIGNTRLVGTIVEASHDEKGIIWPKNVAPFQVHLIPLGNNNDVNKAAENLYNKFKDNNVDVLLDDRDESAGKKLNDADLIGIPVRIVISKKTLAENGVELKYRNSKEAKIINIDDVLKLL